MYHSGIFPGGKIHCNQDLLHVQGAVRDQRRADLPDRGNDRQPEDRKYLFQRRSGEEQVWGDQRQIAEMLSESYLFLLHYEPGDPFR